MTKIAWLIFWPVLWLKALFRDFHDRTVACAPVLGTKMTPLQIIAVSVIGAVVVVIPVAEIGITRFRAIAMLAASILAIITLAVSKR